MSGEQLRKAKWYQELKSVMEPVVCTESGGSRGRNVGKAKPRQKSRSGLNEVEGSECLQNIVTAKLKKTHLKLGREMLGFEEADPSQPFPILDSESKGIQGDAGLRWLS